MNNQLLSTVTSDSVRGAAGLIEHTGFVIPTYNASRHWRRLQQALERQGIQKEQVLVVDSSSSDDTRELVRRAGYQLKTIAKEHFGHGTTRQMAAKCLPWADLLLYLTQDALPSENDSIGRLLHAFRDPLVGAAYGRQLPREEAGPIERHGRLFNYPEVAEVRTFASRKRLGFRAAFFSDSFAAYRHSALKEAGGFPKSAIVSEEVTVAARMLVAGWKIAYQADATATHSHSLTLQQEASRYFDIGVHHGREGWLLKTFGEAGGEGRAFVASELRFLLRNGPSLIPIAATRNLIKWCGYQLGRREVYLPLSLKRMLSGQPNFWAEEEKLTGASNVSQAAA